VRGHFGDKRRAYTGVALRGEERRGTRDSRISRWGWQDVAQVCLSLLFRLDHRNHTLVNELGDYGAYSDGRGRVSWHRLAGTDMEGARKGDGPQSEGIVLHDSLLGCLTLRGTRIGIIEAQLVQQLAHLEQMPFFGVFIDLRKACDAMDWGRCLKILALHGTRPQVLHLIHNFWDTATKVCQAKGTYG
jgi:hypothetical protein